MNGGRSIAMLGSIVLLFGCMLDWVEVIGPNTLPTNGTTFIQGKVALFQGLIFLAICWFYKGKPGKVYSWILWFLALGLGFYLFDFHEFIWDELFPAGKEKGLTISPTIGLFVSMVGTIIVSIGGVMKIPVVVESKE